MRHLMWILTWIAVAVGGALGAASVLMVSATLHHGGPASSIIAGTGQPVLATQQKTGNVIAASLRNLISIE